MNCELKTFLFIYTARDEEVMALSTDQFHSVLERYDIHGLVVSSLNI